MIRDGEEIKASEPARETQAIISCIALLEALESEKLD